MENASKALIMAASVLIAIVIVSAFILMMSTLTDYQESSYQSDLSAQIAEFNNQYTTYIRDDLRGNEIVSLINKVIDYNARKTQEGYQELQITIDIGETIVPRLSYDTSGRNYLITSSSYNQQTISAIVTKPKEIEETYQQKYANQLVSEIANIAAIVDDDSLSATQKNTAFDDENWLPRNASTYGGASRIYQDALQYYEYVQFKRTKFACDDTQTQYDANTGRIIKMVFKCTGIGV